MSHPLHGLKAIHIITFPLIAPFIITSLLIWCFIKWTFISIVELFYFSIKILLSPVAYVYKKVKNIAVIISKNKKIIEITEEYFLRPIVLTLLGLCAFLFFILFCVMTLNNNINERIKERFLPIIKLYKKIAK